MDGEEYVSPTIEMAVDTALRQLRWMIDEKGEKVGIAESRKHLCHYLKGFSGASEARGRVNFAMTYAEVEEILRSYASK